MSARSRATPRKSSVQGRDRSRTRRSETPQTIPEGEDVPAESPSTSGTSASRSRASSPGQKIRIEEKEELKNLNSRLAAYIDRVRSLQDENNRLSVQVRSREEVVTREVTAVKETYEKELVEVKQMLDDATKERAALQVEKRSLKSANQDLEEQLKRVERDLKQREVELLAAQNTANEANNKMSKVQADADRAVSERKKAQDKLAQALADLEGKKKEVDELRKACNNADMLRVEAETKLQNALDRVNLDRNVHEQQLKEVRASKQVEISEVDSRLQKEYETRLEDSVAELRDHYEDLLNRGREDADRVYEEKIAALQADFTRKLADSSSNRTEVRELKTRMEVLTRRLREKEDEAKRNDDRIRDLEVQLANEKDRLGAVLAEKNDAIEALEKQVSELMKQLQDIMEENVRLDMEIATYRNLLEGEESRLNLTPSDSGRVRVRARRVAKLRTPAGGMAEAASSPLSRLWPLSRTSSASATDSPLRKRKRTLDTVLAEESEQSLRRSLGADGDLEIMEVDPKGEFVRVRNKGAADVTMTGYSIKHKVTGTLEEGTEGEITYKFPRISLKANSVTSIWSGNTSVTHQAPDTLKMKEKWTTGRQMRTSLLDSGDKEIAWFQIDHDVSTRASHTSSVRGQEELFHQRGESCCVM